MINIMKIFNPENKTINNIEKQNLELLEEIKDVCSEMAKTDSWFQMESNDDLIEACIYQKEFLNSRYKYLINKVKLNNKKLSDNK